MLKKTTPKASNDKKKLQQIKLMINALATCFTISFKTIEQNEKDCKNNNQVT